MKPAPLPRLFHAVESGDEGYAAATEQHLLDVFDLEGQGCTAAFLDLEGRVVLSARDGGPVPKALARALAEREVAGVGRTLAAKRLWTFALDGWEPGSDVPGPDDPVHLRGRLFGPWPGPKQKLHHGTLTSSRLELLDALVRSARFSIPAAGARAGVHWSNLLLAGGDAKETAAAEDVVLAVPGARVAPRVLGNERATVTLALELIASLQRDLVSGKASGPWTKARLPIASRRALEEDLGARGFTVQGDRAVKKRGGLLGMFFQQVLRMPKEATRVEVLAMARTFLDAIRGWPSERAAALRVLQRPYAVGWLPRQPDGVSVVGFEGWASCESDSDLMLFPSKKAPVAKAWLRLDEGFIAAAPQTLAVELEYRDTDGHLAVLGQTPRAREASSEPLELGGSFMWKKETLLLENVRVENQLEKGASLAIGFRGSGALNVRAVTVKRAR